MSMSIQTIFDTGPLDGPFDSWQFHRDAIAGRCLRAGRRAATPRDAQSRGRSPRVCPPSRPRLEKVGMKR
jgi:hypothetical protein